MKNMNGDPPGAEELAEKDVSVPIRRRRISVGLICAGCIELQAIRFTLKGIGTPVLSTDKKRDFG
jgi:hypothetical protein